MQDKKLSTILRNMRNNSGTCQDPDKVTFNFSSYNLSDYKKIVLSKGLGFCNATKNYWVCRIFSTFWNTI